MAKQKDDWFTWWVNPEANGSQTPDASDLQQTQAYIAQNYDKPTQEKIEIKVRRTREE